MELGGIQGNPIGKNYAITEQLGTNVNKSEAEDKKVKKSSENINASELNLGGIQAGSLKELFGKKMAWKLQVDQFDRDLDVENKINGHSERSKTLLNEAQDNQTDADRLTKLKNDMKETYAIDDESIEQKDLELLEKQAKGKVPLTDEEKNRLASMGPLTEYQTNALDFSKMVNEFQKRADDARADSAIELRTIDAIKLDLLKSNPMLEAKEQAEDILKQVDEEIQKTLVEELKKKVNENLNLDPTDQIILDPQSLINNKKVTEEDLKGLAVDEKV